MAGRGYHLAVEIDDVFARVVRARHPGVEVVVADAARLPDLLAARGLPAADVVVSGLPWTALSPVGAAGVLGAMASSLAAHGAFTTFAYIYGLWMPARRLRRALERTFEEVVPGRTVWANLPAALVYHARRPDPRA